MKLSPIQPHIDVSRIPMNELAANKNVADGEKVAEACRQFEAVLLRQILQSARKSSASAGGEGESSVNSIYDDMINNQLADQISRAGTLGLAKSMQAQVARQVLPAGDKTKTSEAAAKP